MSDRNSNNIDPTEHLSVDDEKENAAILDEHDSYMDIGRGLMISLIIGFKKAATKVDGKHIDVRMIGAQIFTGLSGAMAWLASLGNEDNDEKGIAEFQRYMSLMSDDLNVNDKTAEKIYYAGKSLSKSLEF